MQDSNTETEVTPQKKGISDNLFVFIACLILALVLMGWKPFFVGLGIMPIQTAATLLGSAGALFIMGWLAAKILSLIFKTVSLKSLWLATSVLFFVISLIGKANGQ